MPEEVPEDAEPEAHGRPDPAVAVLAVQRSARRDGDHADAGDARLVLPLGAGQVGHLVAGRDELVGEPAVPALGPADRVRVEAVVDQADMHVAIMATALPRNLLSVRAFMVLVSPSLGSSPMATLPETTTPGEGAGRRDDAPLVSVVIPCLNEAENIEECVRESFAAMQAGGLHGEVVVADNNSTDGSPELAAKAGARVIHEPRRGYGSAYLAGFAAARGEYIVMLDADLTYPFEEIPAFVERLQNGAELVMGDRMDNIQPGAMPWLHQYVGNPILSGILNLFFKTGIRDAHCGMRGFRRDVLPRLDLRTTGMEFASEMVIRAGKENLVVDETPIEYRPRGGESKLSTFRDGWRHLRFLLVHSPTHLFVIPGAIMALLGFIVSVLSLFEINIFGRELQLHSMIAGSLFVIVGTQVLALGLCAHAYGTYFMGEKDPWFDRMRSKFNLEHGLALGGFITFVGFVIGAVIVIEWIDRGFGSLGEERLAIAAATLLIVGIQVFFSSFLLSILGLRRTH
jgi:glycosyltransferase involved in cell wall biosynthesis